MLARKCRLYTKKKQTNRFFRKLLNSWIGNYDLLKFDLKKESLINLHRYNFICLSIKFLAGFIKVCIIKSNAWFKLSIALRT